MTSPLTLGTAGHIDHGKTALIRALTGVDTDRLPEERARGISIELGYASLELPSGRRLSVVDVPGHERFVRTMVAGATGIDLFLMTIASDDGVMPQTREHAAVLEALGVGTGVVAVTKSDLADPEVALLEASELFPASEAVAVSARTGDGLDELRAALDRASAAVASRADTTSSARLHIDRVFTIRGAGTVVTGTLWSGEVGRGDELEILPQGRRVRVRGVQVHDQPLDRAPAGQRVAVNLAGTSVDEIARGDVLVSGDGGVQPSYRVDAELDFSGREPEHGDRVQIHHGTREAAGRLAWLGGRFGRSASSSRSSPRPATGSWCARWRRRIRSAAAGCSTHGRGGTARAATCSSASNGWHVERSCRHRPDELPRPHGRRACEIRPGTDSSNRRFRGRISERGPKNPCRAPPSSWSSDCATPASNPRSTRS